MEKVKITKEQKEALKEFKDTFEPAYWLSVFLENRHNWGKVSVSPLMDFTLEEFALLLAGRYQVEQPFQVGDWVTFEAYQPVKIGKVEGFDHIDYVKTDIQGGFYGSGTKQHYETKQLRHASPDEIAQEKECRRWKEIGREPGEYKVGDVVWETSHDQVGLVDAVKEIDTDEDEIILLGAGLVDREEIKTIVCPVERRLDA